MIDCFCLHIGFTFATTLFNFTAGMFGLDIDMNND